jgi:hypothetical protein
MCHLRPQQRSGHIAESTGTSPSADFCVYVHSRGLTWGRVLYDFGSIGLPGSSRDSPRNPTRCCACARIFFIQPFRVYPCDFDQGPRESQPESTRPGSDLAPAASRATPGRSANAGTSACRVTFTHVYAYASLNTSPPSSALDRVFRSFPGPSYSRLLG